MVIGHFDNTTLGWHHTMVHTRKIYAKVESLQVGRIKTKWYSIETFYENNATEDCMANISKEKKWKFFYQYQKNAIISILFNEFST